MDRIHTIFFRFGIFVEFSNSGLTKLNCAFDVDVALSAGFSSRSRLLRMDRNIFQALLGILGPWRTRQNTLFGDCILSENVLALGIFGLAHGNSYLSI